MELIEYDILDVKSLSEFAKSPDADNKKLTLLIILTLVGLAVVGYLVSKRMNL